MDNPALSNIGIVELLECDTRPTFILDLDRVQNLNHEPLHTAYSNPSFKRIHPLPGPPTVRRDTLAEGDSLEQWLGFQKWATTSTYAHTADGYMSTYDYQNISWTYSTLRRKWRVISGSVVSVKDMAEKSLQDRPAGLQKKSHIERSASRDTRTQKEDRKPQAAVNLSWVDRLPAIEHIQLFKNTDWSATALGPLEAWPERLRQMTRLLMSDSRAAAVFWGPERVVLYNEAYRAVASKKHPDLMGATLKRGWAEIANDLEPVFFDAERMGRATTMEDTPFYLQRHGYLEETFFSYNFVPIRDEIGNTEGFYNAAFETTRQKLWERRTATLLSTVSAPDMASYWRQVLKGFEANERDIPLAVIYALKTDMHDKSQSVTIHLQASLGVEEGHPLALKSVDLSQCREAISSLIQKTISANAPTVFQRDNGTLPDSLLQGIEWRGFGEPSNVLAVLPLTAGEETLGFLLIGLNPRRPYDDDYCSFIELLSRQLSTSLTSAALIEQAKREQAELSKNLADEESKFKALTELNAAGLSPMNGRHICKK